MPRLLVLKHVAHEPLGTLDPLLRSYGFRIRYVNFDRHPDARPSVDGYDGVVVLGGPMNVDEVSKFPHLGVELSVIEEAMSRELPVLGICLGSQLIAKVLGAPVMASPRQEIGWHEVSPTEAGRSDPLFQAFGEREIVFQWHRDTFELPRDAVHLAEGPNCTHQAFRFGENVYGIQFHMEVDTAMIERWLDNPDLRAEMLAATPGVDPDGVRSETRHHIERLGHLSDATFTRFVSLFGPLRRRGPHPHD